MTKKARKISVNIYCDCEEPEIESKNIGLDYAQDFCRHRRTASGAMM